MLYNYNKKPFFSLFLILFFSCSSSKHSGKSSASLPGSWQSQPVTIDGNSKEWPSPYPNYDSKAMVAYATSNDKQNVYVTLQTGDELTQLKILKQGMTLMIDTTGRKDPKLNINYPLQNDNDPLDMTTADDGWRKVNGARNAGRWEKKISKTAEQANQFSIEGFKDCNGGYIITQTIPCGIKVKLRIDEYKELVWEAMIPFKAIYNKDTITAADAGRPLRICFAVKGFKKPGVKNNDNSSNTGMNNNMGGTGMNSRMNTGGGGGRGTTENPLQHLYENTRTWKQFGLAWKP